MMFDRLTESLILTKLPPDQQMQARKWLRRHAHPAWPGSLRRMKPFCDRYGYSRGKPVDRHYIEIFLRQHCAGIHGHTLEVKDSTYTNLFGQGVNQSDVVDIDPNNRKATLRVDLSAADSIASESVDCFIMTQTLQFIYDFHAVIRHAYRILRPGGVLLFTTAGVSRIAPNWGLEGEYWRFTAAACQRMFAEVFGEQQVQVQSYGNMFSSIAFLLGLAAEELKPSELDMNDPYFPVIIGVRAVRRV